MSEKKPSFVKQAAILAAASLVVRFIGFLYRLPLTNLIGDLGNSIYALGYNLYTLFFIISSAGLPAAISKMVSERIVLGRHNDAHKVFRVSLLVAFIVGAICSALLFLFAGPYTEKFRSPESYYSVVALSPTVLIVAVMAVFRGYFQGMKNTVPTAISQIIEQIFNAVFSVYLAYILVKVSVPLGAAGGTAGTGIGAFFGLITIVIIYYIVRPVFKKRMKKSTNDINEKNGEIIKELFGTAVPIILGTAIFSVTNLIDTGMVIDRLVASGAFTMERVKELYGQLTGKYVVLTTLPVSISTALATVSVPTIASSAILKDTENMHKKIGVALRLAMILSIPAAVGMGVLSDQILMMLYPSYPEGGMLLKIGAVSIGFLALTQIVTGILQGMGKTYIPVIAALVGAVVKISLNYFLISDPKINIYGAVLSTIACYAVASLINTVALCKTTKLKLDFMGVFAKPLIASAVMGVSCYVFYYGIYLLLESTLIATVVSIFGGILVYFLLMLAIGGIKREDILLMPFGGKVAKLLNM